MSAVRSIVLIPLLSSACGTVGKVNGGPRPWGGVRPQEKARVEAPE